MLVGGERAAPGEEPADGDVRGRVPVGRLLAVAAAGAVGAFALVFAVIALARPPDPAAQLDATQAYLDEFKPLAEEAGFVVERGLKAGVVDIGNSEFDDETLRGMPRSWGGMLRDIRERMAALDPPEPLREAHGEFLAAMDGYVEVTVLLRIAAAEPPERRLEAAQRAGDHGAATDQVWNAGAFAVQDHLRSLGAEPVAWLPDAADPERSSP